MIPRIAFTIFAGVFFAATGALAACPPDQVKRHPAKPAKEHAQTGNCVDLGLVPQISAHIAATEPQAPAAKQPSYEPSAAAKYEGPTLGLTKPEPGVRPAPTVGYKWSLD